MVKILIPWNCLPEDMKNDAVKPYYEILKERKLGLIIKRIFDIIISSLLMVVLSPVMIIISIMIKLSSPGPIFFVQERVTTYEKIFKIIKFRSMVADAGKFGSCVTVQNDLRVTKIGRVIRKVRLDELPQLINIFLGQMSFVGTRPEVKKYSEKYAPEMKATFLLPAGLTSLASINFKDEESLLANNEDIDKTYVETILPQKMKYNLEYIKNFGFFYDIAIMFKTFFAVTGISKK